MEQKNQFPRNPCEEAFIELKKKISSLANEINEVSCRIRRQEDDMQAIYSFCKAFCSPYVKEISEMVEQELLRKK